MTAVAAAGVTGGCLVFSEPINTPPSVVISDPGVVHRTKAVDLFATASDPDQASDTLKYRWFLAMNACSAGVDVTTAPVSVTGQYRLVLTAQASVCVRVEVTDDHGATGHTERDIVATNQPPVAQIGLSQLGQPIAAAALQNSEFPLYSQLRLTGALSSDPDEDALTSKWSLTQPGGTTSTPMPCPDATGDTEVCVPLLTPGPYTATLEVDDGKGSASTPDTFAFTVAPDHAPCFVAGNPAIARVLRDPASPTRFSVDEVWDDGDPYPPVRPDQQHTIRWNWRKNQTGPWERPPHYTLPFYEFRAGSFDIGDVVEVRVEIEDRVDRDLRGRCGDDAHECTLDTPPRHAPQVGPKCLQRFTWTVEYRL